MTSGKGVIEVGVRFADGHDRTWAEFIARQNDALGGPELVVHWRDHQPPPAARAPALLGAILRNAATLLGTGLVGFDSPAQLDGPAGARDVLAAHQLMLEGARLAAEPLLPASPSFHQVGPVADFWSHGPGAAPTLAGAHYRFDVTLLPWAGAPEVQRISLAPAEGVACTLLRREPAGTSYRPRPATVEDTPRLLGLLLPVLGSAEHPSEGEAYFRRAWNIAFQLSTREPPLGPGQHRASAGHGA